MKNKRIFVLGSGSFSGSHFVDHALSLDAEVMGTNRSPESSSLFLPYLNNSKRSRFKFIQAHLNQDLDLIVNKILEFQPNYIVDFAGQGMVAQSWQNPELWFETNVVSKVKLHDQLKDSRFLEAYLRFSTPEVYGNTNGLIDESAPLNPSTPYATSHAAIDMSLFSFHRRYGFPMILTRATNVYGVGQQLYRIIPKAFLSAKKSKTMTLDGGGTSERNFIAIQDVNRALATLLQNKNALGQAFHLSGSEYVSIRSLVEKIAEITQVPFAKFVTVGAERPGKDQNYSISSTKIQKLTGWTPEVTLQTGLQEVGTWIDQNLSLLENYSWEYQHKI